MQEKYISLGLMSGTSADGVDASIIQSDGVSYFEVLKDKYYEYNSEIFKNIHGIKEKIQNINDLVKFKKEISDLEREITMFHAKIPNDIGIENENLIIGFHGQTIFHNSKERVSVQLGDGKLLNQLTKKRIIYNFRKNDLDAGGEGAPLTPIFHQLIASNKKFKLPTCFLNIGGIANVTLIKEKIGSLNFFSKDIGPGNCLIDTWIRKNSNKIIDDAGNIAKQGKINEIILEQAQELYANRIDKNKLSFDVNDFDASFARGLSLEDGAATLTELTAFIIAESTINFIKNNNLDIKEIFLCGGGRKNKILIEKINKNFLYKIKMCLIDDFELNGDFIESQAFAFLAIRRLLNLPITFPNTTGCEVPCVGGKLIEN